jgi:hypothetical protein
MRPLPLNATLIVTFLQGDQSRDRDQAFCAGPGLASMRPSVRAYDLQLSKSRSALRDRFFRICLVPSYDAWRLATCGNLSALTRPIVGNSGAKTGFR